MRKHHPARSVKPTPSIVRNDYELIIGIDPGVNGGVSVLPSWGNDFDSKVKLYPMPKKDQETWSLLKRFKQYRSLIVIERIAPGFPGTGKTQMAKLFGHYRFLSGLIVAAGFDSVLRVMPRVWQKSLGLYKGKMKTTQHKNNLKLLTRHLYPDLHITLKTCDSLLLAHYGLRLIYG